MQGSDTVDNGPHRAGCQVWGMEGIRRIWYFLDPNFLV